MYARADLGNLDQVSAAGYIGDLHLALVGVPRSADQQHERV